MCAPSKQLNGLLTTFNNERVGDDQVVTIAHLQHHCDAMYWQNAIARGFYCSFLVITIMTMTTIIIIIIIIIIIPTS